MRDSVPKNAYDCLISSQFPIRLFISVGVICSIFAVGVKAFPICFLCSPQGATPTNDVVSMIMHALAQAQQDRAEFRETLNAVGNNVESKLETVESSLGHQLNRVGGCLDRQSSQLDTVEGTLDRQGLEMATGFDQIRGSMVAVEGRVEHLETESTAVKQMVASMFWECLLN